MEPRKVQSSNCSPHRLRVHTRWVCSPPIVHAKAPCSPDFEEDFMIFLLCCRQRKINRGSWLLGKGCASARAGCAWHQLRHVPESTVSGRQMYTQKTFQHTHAPARHGATTARSAGPLTPLLASSASSLSSHRTLIASVSASVPRVASEFVFCPGRFISLPLTLSLGFLSLTVDTLLVCLCFSDSFLPCFVCNAPCLPTRSLSLILSESLFCSLFL